MLHSSGLLRRIYRQTTIRNTSIGRKTTRFSVDRKGLINFEPELTTSNAASVVKEPISPLGKDLRSYIKLKGPITLHDYMAQGLNHLLHGYYQGKGEVIGEEGDFVTAPEISQLFGEMLGIWCLSMWESMGKPERLYLIELGPGKGTLMKDIMKVSSRFPEFKQAVSVHFVELSAVLRRRQYDALACTGLPAVDSSSSSSSSSSSTTNQKATTDKTVVGGTEKMESIRDGHPYHTAEGVSVNWHSFLQQVPSDAPVLVIGQEFLDAFPVHQFVLTEKGWREKLVDVNTSTAAASKKPQVVGTNERIAAAKREVLEKMKKDSISNMDPTATAAVTTSTTSSEGKEEENQKEAYHFRFVLSPSATPAVRSILLNTQSNHSNTASNTTATTAKAEDDSGGKEASASPTLPAATPTTATTQTPNSSISSVARASAKIGDGVEISPLAIATCEDVAQRVVKCGGAALLVDYGEDFTQEDSLRAFYKHKQVSVLSQPGMVDLTADVDFALCRRAAVNKGAKVPTLLTQGEFLMRMGVVSRVEQLLELEETTDEAANALVASLKYLVEPAQMGSRFKVLSIANPAIPTVTGFE